MPTSSRPALLPLVAAFAAVYVIWGSTYLAIRFALESLPPFVMAALRFLMAGGAMLVWAKATGAPWPRRIEWRSAALIGVGMLCMSHGGVVFAETRIPSGLAAVLIGITPIYVTVLEWAFITKQRPHGGTILGLLVGLAGVAWLIGPSSILPGEPLDLVGTVAILIGAMGWASGSLYARQAPLPQSAAMGTAMEMLAGGAGLALMAAATHQWPAFHPATVTTRAWLSLAYLIVFGSLVAFTAYIWLLKHVSPARASTYAYINPVVAVLLGWSLGGEQLTTRHWIASALVIAAVVLITTSARRPTRREA